MALTAANLNVKLTASTAGFSKGFKKVQADLKSFESSLSSLKSSLAGVAAALGVGLSVNAFKNFVQSSMDAIDANVKLADRLGASMEGLLGLQHASDLAGVDVETLGNALDKLNRTLGDGSAAKTLKLLKLNAGQLAGQDPVKSFGQIADAINEIPTSAGRAAAAQDLFGKSSSKLLNVLELGSKGLAENTAEALKLKLAYSRVDAEKIVQANDAIRRTQRALTGIGNTIAIEVSPFLTAAADELTKFAANANKTDTLAKAIDGVADSLGVVLGVLDAATLGWKKFQSAGLKAMAFAQENTANGPIGGGNLGMRFGSGLGMKMMGIKGRKSAFADSLRDQAAAIDKSINFEGRTSAERLKKAIADIRAAAAGNASIAAVGINQKRQQDALGSARKQLEDLATFGQDVFGKMSSNISGVIEDAAKKLTDSTKTPLEQMKEQFTSLGALRRIGAIDDKTFLRGVLAAQKDFTLSSIPSNAAIEAGTPEAFRAAREQDNPLLKEQRKAVEVAKEQAGIQREIVQAIKDTASPVAEIVQ